MSESHSGSGTFSRFSLTDVTSVPPDESPSEASKKMEGNWRYVRLTYPASLIDEKDEFESIFKSLLPKDTCYYGCRELHQDGTCQYHVICDFTATCDSKRWHCRDVRTALAVSGDHDEKINISPPKPRQRIAEYLKDIQDYIDKVKDGDTFGTRIPVPSAGNRGGKPG